MTSDSFTMNQLLHRIKHRVTFVGAPLNQYVRCPTELFIFLECKATSDWRRAYWRIPDNGIKNNNNNNNNDNNKGQMVTPYLITRSPISVSYAF